MAHRDRYGGTAPPGGRIARAPGLVSALAVLAAVGLSGCAPPLEPGGLRLAHAPNWQTPLSGNPRTMDNRLWWQGLKDPVLDAVIARALSGSPTLAAARARSAAAEQTIATVPGGLRVNGGLEGTRENASDTPARTSLRADLGLEWLFDPGGARAAQRQGAVARAALARAEADAAQLLLTAEIAESYLALRHAQARLALTHAEARRLRHALALARQLADAGEGTELEITRAQARLATLETRLPALEAAPAREILRLGVLAGDAPGTLPEALLRSLRTGAAQPQPRLLPDPRVPAELLRNRPDLRLAEARYDSARADLGEARAALYPRLSLSGVIEARQVATPGSSTQTVLTSVGPTLRLPALPQTSTRAGISAAETRLRAAHADWEAAALNALFEVETALADYGATSRAETAASRAQGLHARARDLQARSVEAGEGTLADLLAVEADLSAAQSAAADARLERARAFVTLNLRLGSGG